jgi:hypothetical protein
MCTVWLQFDEDQRLTETAFREAFRMIVVGPDPQKAVARYMLEDAGSAPPEIQTLVSRMLLDLAREKDLLVYQEVAKWLLSPCRARSFLGNIRALWPGLLGQELKDKREAFLSRLDMK